MNQRHQLDGWLETERLLRVSMPRHNRDAWDDLIEMFAPFTEADKTLIDQDQLPTNQRLAELANLAGVKLGTLKHRLIDFYRFRLDLSTSTHKSTLNDDGTFTITTSRSRDKSKGEAYRKCIRQLSGDDSVEF